MLSFQALSNVCCVLIGELSSCFYCNETIDSETISLSLRQTSVITSQEIQLSINIITYLTVPFCSRKKEKSLGLNGVLPCFFFFSFYPHSFSMAWNPCWSQWREFLCWSEPLSQRCHTWWWMLSSWFLPFPFWSILITCSKYPKCCKCTHKYLSIGLPF